MYEERRNGTASSAIIRKGEVTGNKKYVYPCTAGCFILAAGLTLI
jgi:hypothetical protein